MKKYVMIHDENLCIGCQACSVACRNENDTSDGVYRLQVHAEMKGVFPNLKTNFLRHSCVMCENAPCVEVCPTKASFQTDEGIVLLDESICVSCKYCVLACPYDARYVDPITKNIGKCTFCFTNRVAGGEQPACVTVCPTDALTFGDANDYNSEVSKVIATNSIKYPKSELGTKPKLGFVENKKGGRYE
ncbi:putative thiosulfate/polysulfide reductase [4Fe-4S] iron-sulfur binding domain-containing subunit [Campylobacter blaseri]|uniref:Polysulfide reductase chain B n=1 Tax=Campylobacter blaseri TaxID=2042961 RepID=A0A2P8QYJ9_9BACT|nr:4Fe-4S dicluster domain-containing protein [Campylobacter blaseri]PSM51326.1 polysulfide reductase chain B [Campylobacter blaseri]PSM52470.1 polysulfide reductase chain B [Campylobacter blaseri]QKF86198.1 putative thiosulfate/polysulfide reductase [4Fe-4S] iron-sulfur binding domain-containing subunit [Campylobacter blaseri]